MTPTRPPCSATRSSCLGPVVRDEFLEPGVADDAEEVVEAGLRPRRLAEFVGQGELKEHLGDRARGGPPTRARPSTTCCSPARPASARPRSPASSPPRWACTCTSRPARRSSGPATWRRSSPSSTSGDVLFVDEIHRLLARRRGDPLPGDGGLPARHRRRQGPGRVEHPADAAAVHARRRHHPHRHDHRPAARPLRPRRPPRLLRPPTSCEAIVERAAGILDVDDRRRRGVGDRPPLAGHAAHRQPAAAPGARLRRGAARRHASTPATARTGWRCSGSTTSASTRSTGRSSARSVEQFRGGPVGLSTLAITVGEQPETVEDVYEPFLIQQGLLARTPRGRVAMPATAPRRHRPVRDGAPLFEPPGVLRPRCGADRPVPVDQPLACRAPACRPNGRSCSARSLPACGSTSSTTTCRRDRIAQVPIEPRDAARLLVDRGECADPTTGTSATCPTCSRPGDLLVVNETKVIPARLRLRRRTGGAAEVLLLEPTRRRAAARGRRSCARPASCGRASVWSTTTAATSSRSASGRGRRHVRRRAARRRRPPRRCSTARRDAAAAVHHARRSTSRTATRRCTPPSPARRPRPPPGCTSRPSCSTRLEAAGSSTRPSSWSSGSTRSRPVTEDDPLDHRDAHRALPRAGGDAASAAATPRRVVAVGTTARAGARDGGGDRARSRAAPSCSSTAAIDWRVVDLMMTNFHLPRTTLLMMIDAFVGERWRDLYDDRPRRRLPLPVVRRRDAARRTPRTSGAS